MPRLQQQLHYHDAVPTAHAQNGTCWLEAESDGIKVVLFFRDVYHMREFARTLTVVAESAGVLDELVETPSIATA